MTHLMGSIGRRTRWSWDPFFLNSTAADEDWIVWMSIVIVPLSV